MRWTVLGQRVFWVCVLMLAGTYITVVLEKTPVLSVKVGATSPSNSAYILIKTASTPIPLEPLYPHLQSQIDPAAWVDHA